MAVNFGIWVALAVVWTTAVCATVAARTGPAGAASRAIGEITALDSVWKQISIKTDRGEAITITLGTTATIRKVPTGVTDLTKASAVAFFGLWGLAIARL